ncbi:MAG: hypothetical protein KF781_01315 [Chitinophagaceae bacterium]|nr:hypothetical protein [Chitinophagaceae bacterium]MCW5905374.1 hypothetical protein [Chitinophagaceae bacterium]
MDFNYKHLIPTDFSDTSKVWMYQSSRKFTMNEALQIEAMMEDFLANWQSHGEAVKGYANILFGQFLILMADDSVLVGGCSTYESVKVLKQIEQLFNVSLFDRQTLAFITKDTIQLLPLVQLNYALENNHITASTLYFNNLVATKADLLNKWIVPVKETWLASKLPKTMLA